MTRGITARTNPIKNPSFEVDLTGYTSQSLTTRTRDTDEFYFGAASMKLVTTGGTRAAVYGATSGAAANADSIPVPSGRQLVTFSAYMKWTTTPGKTHVKIHWFNAAGVWISDSDSNIDYVPTINTWERLSVTGQPPATAVKYGVALSVQWAGTIYTDGWLVEESPAAGPYFDGNTTDGAFIHSWVAIPYASASIAVPAGDRTNLVANPSFETGIANWTGTSMQRNDTLFAYSGTYCMHFGGGGDTYKSASEAATEGLDYTASAWFNKTTASPRTAAVSIHFFDGGGAELSAPTVTETSLSTQNVPERRVAYRTAPAGTANVQVWIHNANSVGNVQCDAVLLEQSSYLAPYFDGDTVHNWLGHSWTGTAHGSTSTQALASSVRYNLMPNPSFEVDVANWSNTTRSSGPASYPGANTAGTYVGTWNASDGASKSGSVPVTEGLEYTASAWCTKVTASARSCAISLRFFDSAGAELDAPTTALTALTTNGVPERRSHTRTAPTGAVTAQVWYERDSSLQSFDSVLLEQSGVVGDYFDGAWAPSGYATSWLGTAHNSPSILAPMTAPSVRVKQREAEAWNPKAAVPRVRVGAGWKAAVVKRWNGTDWVTMP